MVSASGTRLDTFSMAVTVTLLNVIRERLLLTKENCPSISAMFSSEEYRVTRMFMTSVQWIKGQP